MANPKGITIDGLPGLEARLIDLQTIITGKRPSKAIIKNPEVTRTIAHVLWDTAKMFKTEFLRVGTSQHISQRVRDSAFTYSDVSKLGAGAAAGVRRTSALVGVNKQKTMLEWTAAKNNRSPNRKVPPGGKVAMSLAAIFETGTSRGIVGRWSFETAVKNATARAASLIADELKEIIDRLTASRQAGGKTA